MEYRIMISDRNYSEWYFADTDKYIRAVLPNTESIQPFEQKWFTRDVIRIDETCNGTLVYSPIRNQATIAGVLILDKNKTFGRTANKKRLLYKCIPDDKHLPAFLLAYDVKLGFSKSIVNKYVVFRFESWNETRPHGTIIETLGDVDNIAVFYEYQLYCRSIHTSIADFTNTTRARLNQHTKEEYIQKIVTNPAFRIQCVSRNTRIFSIDPNSCVDFDDAFSVSPHPTNENTFVSVYIANVYLWMEVMDLWKSFSQRVSTIYLPDRKRPMLPTILSDSLCSLQSGQPRFALCMTIEVTPSGMLLRETAAFQNVLVYVSKNHIYESKELLADPEYNHFLHITQHADSSIKDSHDAVMFWMVQMNTICGEYLSNNRLGIFRTATFGQSIETQIPDTIEADTQRFIQQWRNVSSQYCIFRDGDVQHHAIMNVNAYAHITSPIRRLVDLLNMMIFMEKKGIIREFGENAQSFLTQWTNQIEYINTAMRSIRKVQTDCEILRKCSQRPEWLSETHSGVVFDKVIRTDATYSYMVYLTQLRMVSRVNSIEELHNYQTYSFRLFLFQDEENIRNKIRLQFIE
jgi:exoribonuclease R